MLCLLPVTLKVISANSVDPDQTAPYEQSDLGSHCLPVCKNRFEKFARIFSRRHKQTIFSDAGFLGALRVKILDRIMFDSTWSKKLRTIIRMAYMHACVGLHFCIHLTFNLLTLTSADILKCFYIFP